MDGGDGYIISGLIVENFGRVVTVNINTALDVVELRGKNEQGKSTLINAIWVALEGMRVAPKKPIRTGAETARIVVTLARPGEVDDPTKHIVVTRTFAVGKRPTLSFRGAGGWRGTQEMLTALLGALAFDPLEFSRMRGDDRLKALARVSGLDLAQLAAIKERRDGYYNLRHDVNRDAKSRRGQAEGIQFPDGLPAALIDVSAISARLQATVRTNDALALQRGDRRSIGAQIGVERAAAERKRDEAERYRKMADQLDTEAEDLEGSAARQQQRLDDLPPLPEPADTQPLLAEIEQAGATNRYIQERGRREELEREAEKFEAQSKALTEQIDGCDTEQVALIAGAKMPIPEIAVQDEDVLLGGVPWDQASQAQKICASTAIAMAANATLRIVCVRDGSLLDKEHMELLVALCKARGYQLWVEITDNNARVGFVIEDGTARQVTPTEQQSLSLGLV